MMTEQRAQRETAEPGRTPGQAEGEPDRGDQSTPNTPAEPGRTPSQAEGDRETVEQSLREKEQK